MASRSRRAYGSTSEYIKIQGNAVHQISETITRTVNLNNFIESLKNTETLTPILPVGCKLYRKKNDKTIFVIERPPGVKTLIWKYMHEDPTKIRWKLAFPYTIFVMEFAGEAISCCRILYRIAPIISVDDNLLRPNLCNVGDWGLICTGNVRVNGSSMAEKADNYITAFWHSEFNSDLDSYQFRPAAERHAQVRSLEVWQQETETNNLFPMMIPWRMMGSIKTLIDDRIERAD